MQTIARRRATITPYAGPLQLKVQSIQTVAGRGLVVAGHINSGKVEVGQRVQWHSPEGSSRTGRVRSVEVLGNGPYGMPTKNVGLVISNLTAGDIAEGATIWNA